MESYFFLTPIISSSLSPFPFIFSFLKGEDLDGHGLQLLADIPTAISVALERNLKDKFTDPAPMFVIVVGVWLLAFQAVVAVDMNVFGYCSLIYFLQAVLVILHHLSSFDFICQPSSGFIYLFISCFFIFHFFSLFFFPFLQFLFSFFLEHQFPL